MSFTLYLQRINYKQSAERRPRQSQRTQSLLRNQVTQLGQRRRNFSTFTYQPCPETSKLAKNGTLENKEWLLRPRSLKNSPQKSSINPFTQDASILFEQFSKNGLKYVPHTRNQTNESRKSRFQNVKDRSSNFLN